MLLSPGLIEQDMKDMLQHADLVVYTISPTHSFPATYPMLANATGIDSSVGSGSSSSTGDEEPIANENDFQKMQERAMGKEITSNLISHLCHLILFCAVLYI